ncbi:hypothetical protein WG908_04430 [Sphingobium sp. AN641]|uniref:hypothetical protein n=1 Tax=Sphingobium sp. AN641 TaxID=3133443 RepID=UPI0030BC5E53
MGSLLADIHAILPRSSMVLKDREQLRNFLNGQELSDNCMLILIEYLRLSAPELLVSMNDGANS